MNVDLALYLSPNILNHLTLISDFKRKLSKECGSILKDNLVDNIIIGVIIETDQSLEFFKKRRPKFQLRLVNSNEPNLPDVNREGFFTFDCIISYNEFLAVNDKEKLIRDSILTCIRDLKLPRKIADFDLNQLMSAVERTAQ